jgi:hypothetical protein
LLVAKNASVLSIAHGPFQSLGLFPYSAKISLWKRIDRGAGRTRTAHAEPGNGGFKLMVELNILDLKKGVMATFKDSWSFL